MIITADILAEGESGILPMLLAALVFGAISIISSVAKKKQEQAEAEKRRQAGKDGPPPPPGQRAGEPQQRPATEVQRQSLVAAALKSMGIEVPTQQQPKAPPKPKVAPQQVKRKPQPKKSEALGDDIQQHVQEHLQMPKARRARAEVTGTSVHLTAKTARRAMIYHEIFSPPKALRTGGEMWDPA